MAHRTRNLILISLGAAGAGAGLMFFLDPNRGGRRRGFVWDKTRSMAKTTGCTIGRAARDVGNRTWGIFTETKMRFGEDSVSNEVLTERVRSKLGRVLSRPNEIEVSTDDGVVTVKGEVPRSELRRLMTCLYSVRGVEQVRDELTIGEDGRTSSEHILDRVRAQSPRVRTLLAASGGALAVYGVKRRGTLGNVLGAVGAGLLGSEVANTGISRLVQ